MRTRTVRWTTVIEYEARIPVGQTPDEDELAEWEDHADLISCQRENVEGL